MALLRDTCFGGERPLFARSDLRLENVQFYPGDSALKESQHVDAMGCLFMGRYPFWHTERTYLQNCHFTMGSQAAIWYASDVRLVDTVVEAPRMFRQVRQLRLENVRFTNAAECGWNCRDVTFRKVDIKGGSYLLLNSQCLDIDGLRLLGDFALQDTREVILRNACLESNDALWNSENVTVYDSVLIGERLGWHSRNLRLVNCTIHGTQPLCYAKNLVLENCTMVETDRCFEYSTLQAQVYGDILSIKNPTSGCITACSIGELILDENCLDPGACRVATAAGVLTDYQ